MNNIFLLKKGENTNFFADENGALMIKVVNIKNDNLKKDNEEYDKFYKDKIKNKDSLNDIDKLFEQRFCVENLKNFWM